MKTNSSSSIKKSNFIHFIFVFLSFSSFSQNRVYVAQNANGNNNGTSWANAFTNLQTAIDSSSVNDTLWVQHGEYYPTKFLGTSTDQRSKSFLLTKDIHIYGGFSGTESKLSQRVPTSITILSGDFGTPKDSSDNAYHVMVGLNFNGTLNKMQFVHGNASGSGTDIVDGFTVDQNKGGGLYFDSSIVKLVQPHIHNNLATLGGGGIYNYKGNIDLDVAFIDSNSVYGNDINTGGGGGIFNVKGQVQLLGFALINYNRCTGVQGGGAMRNEESTLNMTNIGFAFNSCTGGDGGGAIYNLNSLINMSDGGFSYNTTNGEAGAMYNDGSTGIMNDVQFLSNISGSDGGGAIENDAGSDLVFNNCKFYNNYSAGNGGAIQNWKSNIQLINTIFQFNNSGADGGAVYNYNQCSPIITNCIFEKNNAIGNGGAFYNERDSHPTITSSQFSKNSAGLNGGGIYVKAGAAACNPILTNVTIAYNTAGVSGGGAYDDGLGASKLRNSIIIGNNAPNLDDIDAPISTLATAVFNDIIGNEFYTNGIAMPIIFTAPVFGDTSKIIIPIDSAGPAYNSGDNSFFSATATPNLFTDTNDVRGATRIMGTNIDLGAYEICLSNILPTVSISHMPSFPVLENTSVTFTTTATFAGANPKYIWMVNDTLAYSTTKASITLIAGINFNEGDEIKVHLESSIPCSSGNSADSLFVHVNYIGINEWDKKQNTLQLFPNPNHGFFKLKTNVVADENYQIIIFDLRGNRLHEETIKTTSNTLEKEINLGKTLPSGVYFLSLRSKYELKTPIRFVIF